jgi:tetratricopeptide (TPR) repeat protein
VLATKGHSALRPPGRFRWTRSRLFYSLAVVVAVGLALALVRIHPRSASPHIPASDAQVLAEVPAGARHPTSPSQAVTANRLDIALPLAQFDISQARATGDLRFLGYAEAILAPWMKQSMVTPQVLVLDATILQSRHAFGASLVALDRALKARPDDAQGWLTRATVLRVLGRYDEAMASCEHLAVAAGPAITSLCVQSLRGLTGHLQEAYATISSLSPQQLPAEVRAWRYSELGEMAERLGKDEAAEHWFREGLQLAPADLYMRSACADVLLRHGRAAETLQLLTGYESMEPMLLRVAIAHAKLRDGAGSQAVAQLATAFDVEQRRGDAVHRREQARFFLDVDWQPAAALAAAQENWRVQREPDDILILLRAAQAAHQAQAAATALQFLKQTGLEDARLEPYRAAT